MRSIDSSIIPDAVASQISLGDLPGGVVIIADDPFPIAADVNNSQVVRLSDRCSIKRGYLWESFREGSQDMVSLVLIEPSVGDDLYDGAGDSEVQVYVLIVSSWLISFRVETISVELASLDQNFLDAGHFSASLGVVGGR